MTSRSITHDDINRAIIAELLKDANIMGDLSKKKFLSLLCKEGISNIVFPIAKKETSFQSNVYDLNKKLDYVYNIINKYHGSSQ